MEVDRVVGRPVDVTGWAGAPLEVAEDGEDLLPLGARASVEAEARGERYAFVAGPSGVDGDEVGGGDFFFASGPREAFSETRR